MPLENEMHNLKLITSVLLAGGVFHCYVWTEVNRITRQFREVNNTQICRKAYTYVRSGGRGRGRSGKILVVSRSFPKSNLTHRVTLKIRFYRKIIIYIYIYIIRLQQHIHQNSTTYSESDGEMKARQFPSHAYTRIPNAKLSSLVPPPSVRIFRTKEHQKRRSRLQRFEC